MTSISNYNFSLNQMNITPEIHKYLLKIDGDLIKEFSSQEEVLDFYENHIFLKKENAIDYVIVVEVDGRSCDLWCPYYSIQGQPSSTYKQSLKIIDMLNKLNDKLLIIEGKINDRIRTS